ncbi:MAG TPA: DUF4388 domain-containing protein [Thermodesulfobacteriota bacterium]
MSEQPILEGDLAHVGVFEVLAFLASAGHTAVVEFQFEDGVVKRVHLDRGEIVFASSSLVQDRLGESLVRAGQLTQAQLDIAARAITPTNKLGKVLVEMGCLTPRGLFEAVRRQVEEIVESLFAFERGRFAVTAGLPEGSTRVRLRMPTREFVLQAVGKTDVPPVAAAPAAATDLAPIVDRYDRVLAAISRVMRERGVEPKVRLADFVAGADSARSVLFSGVMLGAPEGLDAARLIANACAPTGAAAFGETPAAYLETGLEELFAFALFAVEDLIEPADAEALAAEIRAIFEGGEGR